MSNNFHKPADFFHLYSKTAYEKDITGMISLYDDNVLVFDMWEKGFTAGIKEWSSIIADWLSSLNDEKVKVLFERIDIQEGADTAFAHALIQFQAISPDGSVIRSMKNRITVGMIKRDGLWKVVHQHTSAPVDSNLKAILDI